MIVTIVILVVTIITISINAIMNINKYGNYRRYHHHVTICCNLTLSLCLLPVTIQCNKGPMPIFCKAQRAP